MLDGHVLSHFIGNDGFLWWIGVIENLQDNLKVGRAKVRIIGHHTPELSTNELPWAVPIIPVTEAAGAVPKYKENDWVFGFFLDGKLAQQPMILGILAAIPQGQPFFKKALKLGVKTIIKSQTGGIG